MHSQKLLPGPAPGPGNKASKAFLVIPPPKPELVICNKKELKEVCEAQHVLGRVALEQDITVCWDHTLHQWRYAVLFRPYAKNKPM